MKFIFFKYSGFVVLGIVVGALLLSVESPYRGIFTKRGSVPVQDIRFEPIAQLNGKDMTEKSAKLLTKYSWEGWTGYLVEEKSRNIFNDWSKSQGFSFADPIWGYTVFQDKIYHRIKSCFPTEWKSTLSEKFSIVLKKTYIGPVALYDLSTLQNPKYKNYMALIVFNEIEGIKRDLFWHGTPIGIGENGVLSGAVYIIDMISCRQKARVGFVDTKFGGYQNISQPRLTGVGLYKDNLAIYSINEGQNGRYSAKLWIFDPDKPVSSRSDYINLQALGLTSKQN